eukprot:1173908-Prorocentrum_minimum.AAC.2
MKPAYAAAALRDPTRATNRAARATRQKSLAKGPQLSRGSFEPDLELEDIDDASLLKLSNHIAAGRRRQVGVASRTERRNSAFVFALRGAPAARRDGEGVPAAASSGTSLDLVRPR